MTKPGTRLVPLELPPDLPDRKMTARMQGLRRNAVWLLSSQALASVLQLAWAILVARSIGQSAFGQYSYCLALTQTAGILSDFGLNLFLIRELSRAPERLERYLGNALGFKMAATLLVWLLLAGIMALGGHRSETVAMVAIFASANFIQALSSLAICAFRANQDMRHEAWAGVVFNLANLGLSLAVLALSRSTILLVVCYLSGTVAQAAYLSAVFVRRWGMPRLHWDPGLLRNWLRSVVWLGLGGAFFFIYDRAPQLLLQSLAGEAQVGAYAVVYRLLIGLAVLPTVAGNVLLPKMSHLMAAPSGGRLPGILARSLTLLFGIGSALALAIFLGAGPLVQVIYGRGYTDSVPVLRILAWQLVVTFPGSVLGSLLIAAGEEKRYALFSLIEMVIGVGVGLVAIPVWGAAGAAAGTLAGTVLVNLMIVLFLRKGYRWLFHGVRT